MQAQFITFEGIDGAGKSTHIPFVRQLIQAQGVQVVLTREPGGTPLGEQLREILLHQSMHVETEAMLMFAARRENIEQVIKPALARGDWVISDRYADSSFAYQGGGRKMAAEKLDALARLALDGLQPDLTLLFDVPLQVARARLAQSRVADKFEAEQAAFFAGVRDRFLQLAKDNPQRIRVIDSSVSIAEIEAQLRSILTPWLAQIHAVGAA